jgi:hypothetical protein
VAGESKRFSGAKKLLSDQSRINFFCVIVDTPLCRASRRCLLFIAECPALNASDCEAMYFFDRDEHLRKIITHDRIGMMNTLEDKEEGDVENAWKKAKYIPKKEEGAGGRGELCQGGDERW